MKILIACEKSGKVRDAFIKAGHDAISCDILPSDAPGPHYQQPVEEILFRINWDLVISFPPCTDLAVSGARYFKEKIADGRQASAINFFMMFTRLKCKWAIENPVGVMSTYFRKPDQIIQPYWFGHSASKSTCLWLNGLPKLTPTKVIPGRMVSAPNRILEVLRWDNQTDSGQNRLSPGPNRGAKRSETYQGIADAMAKQWGMMI